MNNLLPLSRINSNRKASEIRLSDDYITKERNRLTAQLLERETAYKANSVLWHDKELLAYATDDNSGYEFLRVSSRFVEFTTRLDNAIVLDNLLVIPDLGYWLIVKLDSPIESNPVIVSIVDYLISLERN